MPDLFSYLSNMGNVGFDDEAFNEVDNVIFSLISYADFSFCVSKYNSGRKIYLSDAISIYEMHPHDPKPGLIIPDQIPRLLRVVAGLERFRNVKLCAFTDEIDKESKKQFCALSFLIPDGSVFVSFRGTDDTLVGWRENFELSYSMPTPSQRRAVAFLEDTAFHHKGAIRCGGHSKGGNLAVYSAVFCSRNTSERIIEVFNNDGPGFQKSLTDTEGYKRMKGKIRTFVPQDSLVGMLLNHSKSYTVVESSAIPVMQHDPFTWNVSGTSMVHLKSLSRRGEDNDIRFNTWLDSISTDDRKRITELFFGLLEDTGAETLTDLSMSKLHSALSVLRSLTELDSHEKKYVASLLSGLIFSSAESKGKMKSKDFEGMGL